MTSDDGIPSRVETWLELTSFDGCPKTPTVLASLWKRLSLPLSTSGTVGHISIRCSDCAAVHELELSVRWVEPGSNGMVTRG